MRTVPALFLAFSGLLCSHITTGQIRVQGSNPILTINDGVPGQGLFEVTNIHTRLRWNEPKRLSKITVATSCPGQRFALRALAIEVAGGTSAPEVTLQDGMPAMDLVTDLTGGKLAERTCAVRYTAAATFEQGTSDEVGTDVHLVTYTFQEQ